MKTENRLQAVSAPEHFKLKTKTKTKTKTIPSNGCLVDQSNEFNLLQISLVLSG